MRFMVIEGLDGSGKSTQIRLLLKYLEEKNISFRYLHFPRTDSPVFGELIARFLRGDFGELQHVDPYLVALIYAGDRNDAKQLITDWRENDYFVVVDRYVNSNIAFQCAKLKTSKEREELKNWILNLEYEYNRIPQPDISLFLDVPFDFTEKKLSSRRAGEDRNYLNGMPDIHEQSLDFQREVRKVYMEIAKEDSTFRVIRCQDENKRMLTPVHIFDKIKKELSI